MNLETIQSKLQDIEQMRNISTENEAALMRWKGRTGTEPTENSNSSLSFRFVLAIFIAISYDIKLENIENLENIWYTISNKIETIIDQEKG